MKIQLFWHPLNPRALGTSSGCKSAKFYSGAPIGAIWAPVMLFNRSRAGRRALCWVCWFVGGDGCGGGGAAQEERNRRVRNGREKKRKVHILEVSKISFVGSMQNIIVWSFPKCHRGLFRHSILWLCQVPQFLSSQSILLWIVLCSWSVSFFLGAFFLSSTLHKSKP